MQIRQQNKKNKRKWCLTKHWIPAHY
jgi:hypothetical protein